MRRGTTPAVVRERSRAQRHAAARPEPEPLASDVAAIIFTSGTTGAPKGVMMTHRGVLHFARVSAESRALGPDDRVYAYAPMTHIFGLGTVLLASLHAGAALEMRAQFEPAELFDAVARRRVRVQGPPTLFSRLLRHCAEHRIARPDTPCLRYLYAGAGPLDIALKQQVEALFGQTLHHGYGLSEYAAAACDAPR